MLKKILIANRGEIACRVIKSAQQMGIKTVAVYSEADKQALHVEMADEAVCIGPAPSSESYLVVKNIMKAIKDTGADAVHPGYGFLSENAAFAKKLAREKITFIGPKPRAITAMGDKIASKKLAEAAGVSTVPGHLEVIKNAKDAVKIANKIGYPVMLKASAGGGGKGMRVAYNDAECADGFDRATSEAINSFGDDRVFAEKFIEEPRHIEIQVLADSFGNTVYLGERECSIQRRHQKVIEEAPSSFLDEATRKAMGEQAVALAKAVNYQSAGTVEFIVDKDKNFFFLEMNTRLQVEHPVTELITGLDLVELMIRIAAGEKLKLKQEDIKLNGWAIESRIYAEDPFRNFLPSIGRLVHYKSPTNPEGEGIVRVDTGVYEGGEISMYYDPMIAKLVTWGTDRAHATRLMQKALDEFYIRGVSHNIPFLSALMVHPRFKEGNITTNFIAEEYPDGFHPGDAIHDEPSIIIAVAACMHYAYQQRAVTIANHVSSSMDKRYNDWVVVIEDDHHPVHVIQNNTGYEVTIDNETINVVTQWKRGDVLFHAKIGEADVCMQVECNDVSYLIDHAGVQVKLHVLFPHVAYLNKLMPHKSPPDTSNLLLSPMPGLLMSVAVEEGQEIKEGEELAIIEAMKMENVMRASRDCTVGAIHATAGDSLTVDQIIMDFT